MKTEAVWYLGDRSIRIGEASIPEPEANEVLVEMEVCGVCGWDLLAYSGRFARFHPYPFRAGHEGLGKVVKTGCLVSDLPLGTRVACHEIPIDARGGGLMARHAVRNRLKVTPLPDAPLPIHEWIIEPVACALNGIQHAGIQPGDSVALVGAGYMGLLLLQLLRQTLAGRVTIFEPNTRRLELAKSFAPDLGGWNFQAPLQEGAAPEERSAYDVVIETGGSTASLGLAFSLAKPFAIIENFAWHHHKHEFDLDEWHTKGWRILNIQPQMNPSFDALFPAAATLMAAGAVTNKGLVTHVVPFEDAEEVYKAGLDRTGGYIKGVVDFRKKTDGVTGQ
jgi:2-desacetyl-2-hydroxyethyl bacteriochlorophyllide A dehydrogenase